ncbi:hypothetical protein OF83DRAFT_1178835 [Amylostereum chailletii]|nr:hypothetical protein OF83DRAFT_1178835 [Amylostereum chailletii]
MATREFSPFHFQHSAFALRPTFVSSQAVSGPGPPPAALQALTTQSCHPVRPPPVSHKPADDGLDNKRRGKGPFQDWELFEIVQAGITKSFYQVKHGKKGKKEEEFGNLARQRKVKGANITLIKVMEEVILYQEDPALAPRIRDALSDSPYKINISAPLDALSEMKKECQTLAQDDDEKQSKAQKKIDDNKIGGTAIRNASLNRHRGIRAAELSDAILDIETNTNTDDHPPIVLPIPAPPCDTPTTDVPIDPALTTPVADTPACSDLPSTPSKRKSSECVDEHDSLSRSKENGSAPTAKDQPLTHSKHHRANKKSLSPLKRTHVEKEPPTRNTKRVKQEKEGFELQGFLEEERADRRVFQEKLLVSTVVANTLYEKNITQTALFQQGFLAAPEKL